MGGSNTGPINLGNPGYLSTARPVFECHISLAGKVS